MDRENLQRWLEQPVHTWRWNDGDPGQYQAVEATESGLRWFDWSHRIDGPGQERESRQSFAEFLEMGPPKPVPASIVRQIEVWVRERPQLFTPAQA